MGSISNSQHRKNVYGAAILKLIVGTLLLAGACISAYFISDNRPEAEPSPAFSHSAIPDQLLKQHPEIANLKDKEQLEKLFKAMQLLGEKDHDEPTLLTEPQASFLTTPSFLDRFPASFTTPRVWEGVAGSSPSKLNDALGNDAIGYSANLVLKSNGIVPLTDTDNFAEIQKQLNEIRNSPSERERLLSALDRLDSRDFFPQRQALLGFLSEGGENDARIRSHYAHDILESANGASQQQGTSVAVAYSRFLNLAPTDEAYSLTLSALKQSHDIAFLHLVSEHFFEKYPNMTAQMKAELTEANVSLPGMDNISPPPPTSTEDSVHPAHDLQAP